jgi:ubiquinone/menaquinone biosynthesis C-methylase UbiE
MTPYKKNNESKTSTEITKARYNRNATVYNIIEYLPEQLFKAWRKKLLDRAKGEILEIGVGTGKNFLYYPPGSYVIGIDIAEQMLDIARGNALKLGLTFDLREGDVQYLKFPDNSFDTVVATFVFCSVPDPIKGLKEIHRVVKPDGRVLFLEHVRIDKPVIGWLMDRMNFIFVRIFGANINRRTVENVKKSGLQIESLEHFGPMKMVKMIIAKANKDMMK